MRSVQSNPVGKRITLADVARESGFSISAVSIVLNQAPRSQFMASQTKAHIREIAVRLGYRPDPIARSLRKSSSQNIGVMIFDISDPYCTLILQGIEKTLARTAFLPFIMDAYNEPDQFQRYMSMLTEYRMEALIVVANWLFMGKEHLEGLAQHHMPISIVGMEMQGQAMTSVLVDNERGGYLALEHLYKLGHRDIAFIRGPQQLWDSNLRWKGMEAFAKEVGLALKDHWIVQLRGTNESTSGFEEGREMTERLLSSDSKFTAIVAFDDLTAFGAVRALRANGLRVPEDCSVIGFDDVPFAAFFNPGMTTVRQPMEDMGRIATERLFVDHTARRPRSRSAHVVRLEPAIVVRDSTTKAPPRKY